MPALAAEPDGPDDAAVTVASGSSRLEPGPPPSRAKKELIPFTASGNRGDSELVLGGSDSRLA